MVRGFGRPERSSLCSFDCISGCLHNITIHQESAEAVVSWPAIKDVISWLTRSSSVKPPDARAMESREEPLAFGAGGLAFARWIAERQIRLMTLAA